MRIEIYPSTVEQPEAVTVFLTAYEADKLRQSLQLWADGELAGTNLPWMAHPH